MFGDGEGDKYTWEVVEESAIDMPNDDGHPDDPWWEHCINMTDAEKELLYAEAMRELLLDLVYTPEPDKNRVETRFNTPYCFY